MTNTTPLTAPGFAVSRISYPYTFATGYTAHLVNVPPSLYLDIQRAMREIHPAPAVPIEQVDMGSGPVPQENPLNPTYQAAVAAYDTFVQQETLRAYVDAMIEVAMLFDPPLPSTEAMQAAIDDRETTMRRLLKSDAFTLTGSTPKAQFVRAFVDSGRQLDEALEIVSGKSRPSEAQIQAHEATFPRNV
jgi:hypothetical protein